MPIGYPSNVLSGLRAALRPRRTNDIELPPEDLNWPPYPPTPDIMPEPYLPERDIEMSRLPELMQPGALGPGETYTQQAYTGELGKGTASYGGPKLNTTQALSGLRAAQGEQLIPGQYSLGEAELTRLAGRAPETTAPGANQYFGRQLQEELGRQASFLGPQRKAQEAISGAIAGLHPAVQAEAEREAQRKALPQMMTGQMGMRQAELEAESRQGVAESNRRADVRQAKMGHLNSIAAAIARIQAKPSVRDEDLLQIKILQQAYDALADQINEEELAEYDEYDDLP